MPDRSEVDRAQLDAGVRAEPGRMACLDSDGGLAWQQLAFRLLVIEGSAYLNLTSVR
jgi:hypothetical protein